LNAVYKKDYRETKLALSLHPPSFNHRPVGNIFMALDTDVVLLETSPLLDFIIPDNQ
jgi:hypothetical protein